MTCTPSTTAVAPEMDAADIIGTCLVLPSSSVKGASWVSFLSNFFFHAALK